MRRDAVSLILSFFLLSATLPVLVAHGAESSSSLTLDCDKPVYYLKGEPLTINAMGNSSVSVTLSIYWNWRTLSDDELVYRNTKTLNASWTLPTASQRVGFYRIEANTSTASVSVWRTVLHATDYQVASLPFSHEWGGVNYTVEGRTFRAETPEDFIEVTYPKIPFLHNTRFYHNNMTFLVRLDGTGWAVDLAYMTVHSGLKWRINGTLDNPQTFEFACAHNPLQTWTRRLDRLESDSFLVFDWDDLRRAGEAFSWDSASKTLSVTVPSTFDIDPAIFEEGFEGEWYSPWDTWADSGTPDPDFVDTYSHHGDQSLNFSLYYNGHFHWLLETVSGSPTEFYQRAYCYITHIPRHSTGMINGLGLRTTAGGAVGNTGFFNDTDDDEHYWTIMYKDGGVYMWLYSDATTINLNTWYCVEWYIYLHDTAGNCTLWVDGEKVISRNDLDTNDYAIVESGFCIWNRADSWSRAYFDCYVSDDEYIGEESELREEFFTFAESTTVSEEATSWTESLFQSTETVAPTSDSSALTASLFTSGESATVTSTLSVAKAVWVVSTESCAPQSSREISTETFFTDYSFVFSATVTPLESFVTWTESTVSMSETVVGSVLQYALSESLAFFSSVVASTTSLSTESETSLTFVTFTESVVGSSSSTLWLEVYPSEKNGSLGVYWLTVFLSRDGFPCVGTVIVNGVEYAVDTVGRVAFQLPYGTYLVEGTDGDMETAVEVLLNQDKEVGLSLVSVDPVTTYIVVVFVFLIVLVGLVLARVYLFNFRKMTGRVKESRLRL